MGEETRHMKPGTPLPSALSGNVIERLIKIDEALIYLIGGMLEYLTDKEKLEQTGTLTVEGARTELSNMIWDFYHEEVAMTPIGGMMEFAGSVMPDKWLLCNGAAVDRTIYANLFAKVGLTFGAGDGVTTFNIPNMIGRSPYGKGDAVIPSLGQTGGTSDVTLITNQIPSHNHGINDPGHFHQLIRPGGASGSYVNVASASLANPVNTTWPTQTATTGISINNTGGGLAHNNLHPVLGMNFIIYAGV